MSNEAKASLHYEFVVQGGDFNRAGDASSRVKKILQQIGVDPEITRRVAVSCYEAEMNVVIHANHGIITLNADPEMVEIIVDDVGPGIEDIELAMTPGYSTAPESVREMGFGAGMGLPNIKNNSSSLEITSEKGVGTKVKMVFYNA
ncbi:MAG: ATP-binding protein [Armatimonadota bacterium]